MRAEGAMGAKVGKKRLVRLRIWLSPDDVGYLHNMADDGGYELSALIRSLLRGIIEDDREAHSERAA